MKLVAKLATLAATAVASFLAPRLVTSGWKAITGHEPPGDDPTQDRTMQIVVFAAVSAVVTTMLRQLALKGADRAVARAEGEEKKARSKQA